MNNQTSLEHVERKTFLLAEQMQQLQEYATEFREESKRTVSSQEESTSQLRALQDEINQQANEIQSHRSELVREEARLQQLKKSLQEEKSAWAATQKYATSENTGHSNAGNSTGEGLQTGKEIEQQIEDWKLQVEKQNEIHLSRKIAFEKRLSSIAQWEESIAHREEKADAQGEKLLEYETKLALKEHEIVSEGEPAPAEKQEETMEETPSLDNELDINFGTLFEEETPKKEDEKKENTKGVRSALADMFDLSADQLTDKDKPVEDQNEEAKAKSPQMMEVELESARFMSMNTEPPKVAGASEEPIEEEKAAEDENSVSAYMERLLARTQNGKQEPAPSQPVVKIAPEVTNKLSHQEPLEELPEEVEEPAVSTEPKHKLDREEVRMQRDSLRELANYSARTDIAKYTTNQMHLQLILKYLLTGVSLLIAGALLTSQMWGTESYFSAGLVALGVFAVMGMELLRSLLLVRRVNSVDGNSTASENFSDNQASQNEPSSEE